MDATDTDREPQIEMIPGTLVVFADDCGHATAGGWRPHPGAGHTHV